MNKELVEKLIADRFTNAKDFDWKDKTVGFNYDAELGKDFTIEELFARIGFQQNELARLFYTSEAYKNIAKEIMREKL